MALDRLACCLQVTAGCSGSILAGYAVGVRWRGRPLDKDADAMEWQERIWHWQASAEESSCKTALLEVGTI